MASTAPQALTPQARSEAVKARARELGFAAAGVADLAPIPHRDAIDRWLANGYAGTMRYMHRQAAKRKDPSLVAEGAKFAVVVLYNYGTNPPGESTGGLVAAYARGRDYHDGLRPALEALAQRVLETGTPETGPFARVYVDAGPVPERELAQRAGLGWIGKNTMLIDPSRGSYTLLATILTNVELGPDAPFEADRCGTCRRCLDACPTGAFPEPRVLDATRCISYLTIEHRGPFRDGPAQDLAGWIFGCDVCQEVCPWNAKFSAPGEDRILGLDPARSAVPLDTFDDMDEATFTREFGWTPLERAGLEGMRRNTQAARGRR